MAQHKSTPEFITAFYTLLHNKGFSGEGMTIFEKGRIMVNRNGNNVFEVILFDKKISSQEWRITLVGAPISAIASAIREAESDIAAEKDAE